MLLADDDTVLLNSMRRALEREGLSTTAVATCREALAALDTGTFDAVISDLRLGDGLGTDVARRARSLEPIPGVLILSGHPSVSATPNLPGLDGVDCLQKPVASRELVQRIIRMCGVPATASAPAEEPAEGRSRVLILDDDPSLLRLMGKILGSAGFDTERTSSGSEALRLLSESSFDLVVSDISMPEMSGTDFLAELRRRGVQTPVIFVTGLPELDSAIRAVELGAFRYLTKPFDRQEIVATARRAASFGRIARVTRQAGELAGEDSRRDQALRQSFRSSLESLWVAAQPIVANDIETTVYGYELLLRNLETSEHAPHQLFAVAEQLGGIPELSRRVYDLAAAVAEQTQALVFVNVHPLDLLESTLFDAESPLAAVATRVVLEITERARLDDIADLRARITELRTLGYRIAVDDLGAGYAALSSLVMLQPDFVKVDMSLVRDVDSSPVKQSLIASIVRSCRDLGMLLVAEGVETDAEWRSVTQMGCDLVQGYRVARPGRPFPTISALPTVYGG